MPKIGGMVGSRGDLIMCSNTTGVQVHLLGTDMMLALKRGSTGRMAREAGRMKSSWGWEGGGVESSWSLCQFQICKMVQKSLFGGTNWFLVDDYFSGCSFVMVDNCFPPRRACPSSLCYT